MSSGAWLRCTLCMAWLLVGSRPLAGQAGTGPDPRPASTAGRSLVVPGWGQLARSQKRGWAYLAAEAALWAVWLERRGAAADARASYRDLAWAEARLATGSRVDGDWAYYENLSKWQRSGAFDRDPTGAGLQPETDPATFNGSIWALARGIYSVPDPGVDPGDPRVQQALAYYSSRAYPDALLWDWTGREGALDRYRDLIHESDDRSRQATAAVGAVIANHLLSATDAYLSASAGRSARVRLAPPTPFRGWGVALALGVGR